MICVQLFLVVSIVTITTATTATTIGQQEDFVIADLAGSERQY